MSWLQLSIDTDSRKVEALSELLEKFGAVSVSLAAVDDEAVFGEPGFGPVLWKYTRITALLPADIQLDIVLLCIRNRIGDEHIHSHSISLLKDRDWVAEFKQGQRPLIIADRLCISPSWYEPPPDVTTIRLDPGLAFGTGTHSTTSLCLQWLVDHDLKDKTVIDYGCGTGILAMVAARLGAANIFATDIDPQAIKACLNNLNNNKLEKRVKVMDTGQAILPAADVLIANILMNPLIELAEKFANLVKPDAALVLSGILYVQIEECLAAYSPWFNIQEPVFDQEWALLSGVRKV